MIRVLLADDQVLVRAGFRVLLDAEPDIEVVGEADDGEEAVRMASELVPDVVLMDIRMPNVDGLEATRRLVADARLDRTRIVILTTFDLDEYVFEALRAGASGFLLKDVPRRQLVEAVHVVAAGEALLSPSVTKTLIERFAAAPSPRPDERALEPLTAREREALGLLAKGLTNAEMAEAMFVGEATVKTHVGNVLMKLGLRDRVQAVIFAYENGVASP